MPDGTPIYKSVFAKTQKELMPKLHALIDEYRGVEVTDCDMTLQEWAEKWLTEYAEPTLRPSTMRGYRSNLKTYINPTLGDRQLRGIRQKDVQRFYNALKRRRVERGGEVVPIADSTVRKAHLLLHEIMDAAVSARLISRNPTNGTKVPKANYAPKAILNEEQLDRFMEVIRAEPCWYDFFYTEITTGLRRGEICGLKWSDLDENGGRLTVRRTVKRVPAGSWKSVRQRRRRECGRSCFQQALWRFSKSGASPPSANGYSQASEIPPSPWPQVRPTTG